MTPSMILTELAVVLMVVLLVTLFLALPVLVVVAVVGVANMVRCRRTGDASGARSRLHGLSMVMNMTLADLLVLAVLAAVVWLPPAVGRTWCESHSPDGVYAVEVDRMSSLPILWEGMPVKVTVAWTDADGHVKKASLQAVLDGIDVIDYSCVISWRSDYVSIGAHRKKNPDRAGEIGDATFFRIYWDDVEWS